MPSLRQIFFGADSSKYGITVQRGSGAENTSYVGKTNASDAHLKLTTICGQLLTPLIFDTFQDLSPRL